MSYLTKRSDVKNGTGSDTRPTAVKGINDERQVNCNVNIPKKPSETLSKTPSPPKTLTSLLSANKCLSGVFKTRQDRVHAVGTETKSMRSVPLSLHSSTASSNTKTRFESLKNSVMKTPLLSKPMSTTKTSSMSDVLKQLEENGLAERIRQLQFNLHNSKTIDEDESDDANDNGDWVDCPDDGKEEEQDDVFVTNKDYARKEMKQNANPTNEKNVQQKCPRDLLSFTLSKVSPIKEESKAKIVKESKILTTCVNRGEQQQEVKSILRNREVVDGIRKERERRRSKSETDVRVARDENVKLSKRSETEVQTHKSKSSTSSDSRTASCSSIERLPTSEHKMQSVRVKGRAYFILNQIGQGGSSKVYQVYESQMQTNLALKVVDLSKADESTKVGYKNEINLLMKLRHCKRVVRIIDYEETKNGNQLLVVMEKGDSDLANVIKQFVEADVKYSLDHHLIKHYWKEMLKTVDEIHECGIVHSDLKPVNFITVAGKLKLIDFGIANAIQAGQTSVFKDHLIGTINYMAPESLQSQTSNRMVGEKNLFKFNCKADIWSLGCILYNLVYGRPPFHGLSNVMAKMQAITNPKYKIEYLPTDDHRVVDCIKMCLERDASKRPTAKQLLDHPFLSNFKKDANTRLSNSCANTDLNEILSQVNSLTPHRMEKLSKFVEQLSTTSRN